MIARCQLDDPTSDNYIPIGWADQPRGHAAQGRDPFKIQAKYRDRIAFVRLASGHFTRGMKLTVPRTGKSLGVHNAMLFQANERELAEEAWAGDIIGIPNHGTLRIG